MYSDIIDVISISFFHSFNYRVRYHIEINWDNQWLLNNKVGLENYDTNLYRLKGTTERYADWLALPLKIDYDKYLYVSHVAWWIDAIGSTNLLINNASNQIQFKCVTRDSTESFILIISYI